MYLMNHFVVTCFNSRTVKYKYIILHTSFLLLAFDCLNLFHYIKEEQNRKARPQRPKNKAFPSQFEMGTVQMQWMGPK